MEKISPSGSVVFFSRNLSSILEEKKEKFKKNIQSERRSTIVKSEVELSRMDFNLVEFFTY